MIMHRFMNPNSPKALLAAFTLALLIALALLALPVAIEISPWYVIAPLALIILIIRGVDARRNRHAGRPGALVP